MVRRASPAVVALVVALVAGCGDGGPAGEGGPADRLLVEGAAAPAALAALPDGGLLYGERLTGRIRRVDRSGRLRPEPLARLSVSTEDQRGLLGLAVDPQDRIFAAWTDPNGTILVGQIAPGPVRVVWRGPPSARLGNGGHLDVLPDGALLVGIGDLGRDDRSGRLLALDADGSADQTPRVVSLGWNNPFAFAPAPGGSVWVADNAPGEEPERLVRVGADGQPAFARNLPGRQVAPAGLVVLADGQLVLCAYLPARLLLYDVDSGRSRTLADGCRTGVVRLTGGDLAYAGQDDIRVIDDPLR